MPVLLETMLLHSAWWLRRRVLRAKPADLSAPEFYKKLGYELEFVRKDSDSKLSKYFYLKKI